MASPADRAFELVAQRQARRRAFNARLAAHGTDDSATPFRCECGLVACGASIQLDAEEYVSVRSDPLRFVVLAEHAMEDTERVIASRRGWAIVEKFPGVGSEVALRAALAAASPGRADAPQPPRRRAG